MRVIENSIEISRSTSDIFDYVTRPAKWYEWFPSSKKSDSQNQTMTLGNTFSVATIQKPFKGLFPPIEKLINWKVIDYQEALIWRITSSSTSFDLDTQYQLTQTSNGTLFVRSFRYKAKGLFRMIEPIALRRGFARDADIALNNLKTILEKNT